MVYECQNEITKSSKSKLVAVSMFGTGNRARKIDLLSLMVLEVRGPGPCAGAGHLAISVLRQHEASCERNGEQAACLCLWVILPMSVSS